MTVPREQIWFIVANPSSCSGKLIKKWPSIEKYLHKLNVNFVLSWTKEKNHATQLTYDAIESGYRIIISVGGDGTHNEVVNGLMKQKRVSNTEITFGVIPGGTGNDWIKTHNIPVNYRKSIDLIRNGQTKIQDVGLAEYGNQKEMKRYFINAAGFAYDAYLVKQMTINPNPISSSFAYMFNILKYLIKYKAEKIKLQFENRIIEDHFYTINACLGKFAGGGLMIAPHAKHDDGKLAMTMAYKLSKLQILLNLYRFYNGTIGNHPKIDTTHTKSILVTNDEKEVDIEVDGEYLGKSEVRISVIPSSLKLFC